MTAELLARWSPSVSSSWLSLVLACCVLACGEDADPDDSGGPGDADMGQTDEGTDCMPYCEETLTSLELGADTALGVSSSVVVDPLPAEADASLEWMSGQETALVWGVEADLDSLRFAVSEEVYPTCEGEDVPAIGVYCPDYIGLDGVLTLSAPAAQVDGAVALTFTVSENTAADGTVEFSASLVESDLGASFVLSDHLDASSYDSLSMSLMGQVSASGALRLSIFAQGTGTDGGISWAENIELATVGGGIY